MSILQTQTFAQAENMNEFKIDASASFEKIREIIYVGNDQGRQTYKTSTYDRDNLKLLKKQLGMERQELMLKQLMTKNNPINNNVIGNDFNNLKYLQVQKYNDMICIFLLYFIHEASWLKQPDLDGQIANAIATNNLWTAARIQPTGIPYDIIFDKIKKVLPFLSNLFMDLIEDKFPTGVSVQVSQYQDLQERLDQAQLTGKITSENKKVKKVKK